MIRRFVGIALIAGAIIVPAALRAEGDPGGCSNDTKLLNGGPTRVYGEGPGTWWGLIIGGVEAAGITLEADQLAYLNHCLNTAFTKLADLKKFNLDLISQFVDKDQNGYVCADALRGTRTSLDSPFVNLTYFTATDDLPNKNN